MACGVVALYYTVTRFTSCHECPPCPFSGLTTLLFSDGAVHSSFVMLFALFDGVARPGPPSH